MTITNISIYAQSCIDDNHPHAIDLGLPSGTKWACCNIGSTRPEDYGNYYSWGETWVKEVYNWKNYLYFDTSKWKLPDIPLDIRGTEFDTAFVIWGNSWKMFSKEQCQELIDYCSQEISMINDVKGISFIGPNGNSIFFPAAGYCTSDINYIGDHCYYWAGTREFDSDSSGPYGAHTLSIFISLGLDGMCASLNRVYGANVRPIIEGKDNINDINITNKTVSDIFNISGMKMPNNYTSNEAIFQKLYIINGKKILIKK